MHTFTKTFARAALIALLAAGTAQASVVFTVTRLSDTTASVVGSGTLDEPKQWSNGSSLVLDNLFTVSKYASWSALDAGSTMTIGSQKLIYANAAGAGFNMLETMNPVLYFGPQSSLSVGDSLAGSLLLKLGSGEFAAAGSTGNVYWGSYGPDTRLIGTYSIVDPGAAVPEPASLAILGLGLAGLAVARRRAR